MYRQRFSDLIKRAKDEMHRDDILGFPRARLVLEAQATLMGFLPRTVELILGNSHEDQTPLTTKWNEMTKYGFKKSGESVYWFQYVCQPFSAPQQFNLNKLLSQAMAQVDATSDHLWLLQTEPSYLKHYMRPSSQYEALRVSDIEPARIAIREMSEDFQTHLRWQWVYDELMHANRLYHRFRDSIHPGSALPKPYDPVVATLELLLVNMMHKRAQQTQTLIPQRPGFRHLHIIKVQKLDDKNSVVEVRHKLELASTKALEDEPLWWCAWQLQGAPDDQRRFSYGMLFSFLDELVATSSTEERSRLDEVLYAKLSDLAATHEMLTTIRFARLRITNGEASEVIKDDSRKTLRHLAATIKDLRLDQALVNSFNAFQRTPLPSERKNRDWIRAFDAMHTKMQDFWRFIHKRSESSSKESGLLPEDVRCGPEPLEFWNTTRISRTSFFQAKEHFDRHRELQGFC
ncbi:MAG: hypothetical protein MMC23_000500 [Stictis urceolatum]|nr:hypothetical protein [Stictis urceolata]